MEQMDFTVKEVKDFTPKDVALAKENLGFASAWLNLAASVCEDSKTEEKLNKVIDSLEIIQISIDSVISEWRTAMEAIA